MCTNIYIHLFFNTHLSAAWKVIDPWGEPDRKRSLGWKFPSKWLEFRIIWFINDWKSLTLFFTCVVFRYVMEWVHGVMGVLTGSKGFKIGCLLYHSYCWWFRNPAADEVGSLSMFIPLFTGFVHARWLFGISELSTVCFLIVLKDMPANHVDTVSCKDDFAADVAKLKEEETTSVKQFEAGQLEGIFFGGQQGGCRLS